MTADQVIVILDTLNQGLDVWGAKTRATCSDLQV